MSTIHCENAAASISAETQKALKALRKFTLPKPDTLASIRRANGGYLPFGRVWYVTPAGVLVRKLTYTDYEPCQFGHGPRELTMRLRPDDPRPLGRRIYTKVDAEMVSWFARRDLQEELGVWYETLDEAPREVPPYRDWTALMVLPGKERAA